MRGTYLQACLVQTLLPREDGAAPPPPLPYPDSRPIDIPQPSPAVLMQMLQNVLQMQQQS